VKSSIWRVSVLKKRSGMDREVKAERVGKSNAACWRAKLSTWA
jgi:hypothetical protein